MYWLIGYKSVLKRVANLL